MSEFLCPKCSRAMREESPDEVPHDVCEGCGGVWMDYASLNLWLDKRLGTTDGNHGADLLSLPQSVETPLACPRCPSFLLECTTTADMTVEWCNACRGLFLDRGELSDVAAVREAEIQAVRRDSAKAGLGVLLDLFVAGVLGYTDGERPGQERRRKLNELWRRSEQRAQRERHES